MWAGHLPTAVVTVVLLDRVGLRDATLTLEITAMTDDKIALGEPLEKGSDATLLREMIDFAARRLMQLETDDIVRRRAWRTQRKTGSQRLGPE